ncbi:hypothetical protein EDC01DRAFT_627207 [Geopyxis carbonaria]|nr:hypothetical protein EDC01DRAFT_627207 [Geopyxis carbonaria]
MSVSVASKNLYELLGNDPPEEEQPSKAPRQVVKATTSSRKRDEKVAPAEVTTGASRGNGRGNGRGRFAGNDGAFRDRDAGRDNNRSKSTAEGGAPTRGRGGRGGRGGRRDYDRHSATGRERFRDSDKQVDQGWGAQKGESEWKDEIAAVEIAEKDATGADSSDPNAATADAEAAVEEEEQKTKTYDEYLAELAQRQADLGPPTEVRRPNEGSRTDKKWATAKEIKKEEDAAYFAGEAKDKTRNRERKTKQVLDIEPRYVEPRDGNRRGGSDRGGRGRGEGRGGRGRGDRGAPRGDRGDRSYRGDRPAPKGGNAPVSLGDDKAFPALGA